jgi:NTE family protein
MRRFVLVLVLIAAACSHAPVNSQLRTTPFNPAYGYRYANIAPRNNDACTDDTFVIVTMSGGGTRAAAFAYGVLQKLAETKIHHDTSDMLAAVDVISSVSGGSFLSTYYALNGREGLPAFKENFLKPNVEKGLFLSALKPWNLLRLLFSPNFTRIDLAANYYDQHLYHGATYKGMPLRRPYIVVNSTEMDIGSQFQFTQEQFDPICSNLSELRVADAVASSSAFPGLLVPVTMGSWAGKCQYKPPDWYGNAANDFHLHARRFRAYTDLMELKRTDRPNLHLIDGGIADNIGLRGPMTALTSVDTWQSGNQDHAFSVLRMVNNHKVKRVGVIIVDAKTENTLSLDRSSATPSLINVVLNISETPMANYSTETVQLMIDAAEQLQQAAASAKALHQPPMATYEIYPIYVSFAAADDETRKNLNKIGTNFSLKPEELKLLIDSGAKILADTPEFQQLVKDLQP